MNNRALKDVKPALFALLLILLGVGLAWAFRIHSFSNLSNEAMESAQVARNISESRGFTTSVIPVPGIGISNAPEQAKAVPELHRAPLYPILLAGAFFPGGVTDGTVITFSSLLYVLSGVLLFLLAQRVLKQLGLAFAVALAYLLSVPALFGAISGQMQPLSAVLLLALLLSLTPKNEADEVVGAEATAPPINGQRLGSNNFFAVGVLTGLCYLTDYCSLFYTVPLLMLWPSGVKRWSAVSVLTFLAGFTLICAPWWIRNFRLTHDPFYGMEWLILTGKSSGGESVLNYWRVGLGAFIYNAVMVPHLLLTPFVLVSFWIRPVTQPLARRMMAILIATVCAIVALAAFGRIGTIELVPLAPLLTILGIATFYQVISNSWFTNAVSRKIAAPLRFEPVPGNPTVLKPSVTRADKFWRFHEAKLGVLSLLKMPLELHRNGEEESLYAGKWPLKAVYEARALSALALLLFLPLGLRLLLGEAVKPLDIASVVKPLSNPLTTERVVVTDMPQVVAWYSKQITMPLPERLTQFLELTKPPVGALYLADSSNRQASGQWRAAYNGIFIPGYENIPLQDNHGVLYLRQPSAEEATALVKEEPKSAAKHVALGKSHMLQSNFAEALAAFSKAQALDPKLAEAFVDGADASFRLRDMANARKQLERGLQLSPRSTSGLLMMAQFAQMQNQPEQAIRYYEHVLADAPNNPYALNNLANLYQAQPDNLYRALEMARRVVAQNPNNGSALDTLGWTCYRLGYRQEALQYLKQAAKLSPQNATIQDHLKQALGTTKAS